MIKEDILIINRDLNLIVNRHEVWRDTAKFDRLALLPTYLHGCPHYMFMRISRLTLVDLDIEEAFLGIFVGENNNEALL